MADGQKTYKVGEDVYDIPEDKASSFKSKYPDAVEVQSFIHEKDTFDIPLDKVDKFKAQFPQAQSLTKKTDVPLTEAQQAVPALSRIGATQILEAIPSPFPKKKEEPYQYSFDEIKTQEKPLPAVSTYASSTEGRPRVYLTKTVAQVKKEGKTPTFENYIASIGEGAGQHIGGFVQEGAEQIAGGLGEVKQGAKMMLEDEAIQNAISPSLAASNLIPKKESVWAIPGVIDMTPEDAYKISQGAPTNQALKGFVKVLAGMGHAGIGLAMHATPTGIAFTEGLKVAEAIAPETTEQLSKYLFAPVTTIWTKVNGKELSDSQKDIAAVGDIAAFVFGAWGAKKGYTAGEKVIIEKINKDMGLTPDEMNKVVQGTIEGLKDPEIVKQVEDAKGLKMRSDKDIQQRIDVIDKSLPENKVVGIIENKKQGKSVVGDITTLVGVDKKKFEKVVNAALGAKEISPVQAKEMMADYDAVQGAKSVTREAYRNNPEIIQAIVEIRKREAEKKQVIKADHPEIDAEIKQFEAKIAEAKTKQTPAIAQVPPIVAPTTKKVSPELQKKKEQLKAAKKPIEEALGEVATIKAEKPIATGKIETPKVEEKVVSPMEREVAPEPKITVTKKVTKPLGEKAETKVEAPTTEEKVSPSEVAPEVMVRAEEGDFTKKGDKWYDDKNVEVKDQEYIDYLEEEAKPTQEVAKPPVVPTQEVAPKKEIKKTEEQKSSIRTRVINEAKRIIRAETSGEPEVLGAISKTFREKNKEAIDKEVDRQRKIGTETKEETIKPKEVLAKEEVEPTTIEEKPTEISQENVGEEAKIPERQELSIAQSKDAMRQQERLLKSEDRKTIKKALDKEVKAKRMTPEERDKALSDYDKAAGEALSATAPRGGVSGSTRSKVVSESIEETQKKLSSEPEFIKTTKEISSENESPIVHEAVSKAIDSGKDLSEVVDTHKDVIGEIDKKTPVNAPNNIKYVLKQLADKGIISREQWKNLAKRADAKLTEAINKKERPLTKASRELMARMDEVSKISREEAMAQEQARAEQKGEVFDQEKFEKKWTDRVIKVLEGKKLSKGDDFSAIFGSFVPITPAQIRFLWNGSIDIAINSIRAGVKISKAIEDAINYMRNSDWYKSQTIKNKVFAEKALAHHIEEGGKKVKEGIEGVLSEAVSEAKNIKEEKIRAEEEAISNKADEIPQEWKGNKEKEDLWAKWISFKKSAQEKIVQIFIPKRTLDLSKLTPEQREAQLESMAETLWETKERYWRAVKEATGKTEEEFLAERGNWNLDEDEIFQLQQKPGFKDIRDLIAKRDQQMEDFTYLYELAHPDEVIRGEKAKQTVIKYAEAVKKGLFPDLGNDIIRQGVSFEKQVKAVIDVAADLINKAIDAGLKGEELIKKVIEDLKGTDLYKKLSSKKKFNPTEVENTISDMVKEREKLPPTLKEMAQDAKNEGFESAQELADFLEEPLTKEIQDAWDSSVAKTTTTSTQAPTPQVQAPQATTAGTTNQPIGTNVVIRKNLPQRIKKKVNNWLQENLTSSGLMPEVMFDEKFAMGARIKQRLNNVERTIKDLRREAKKAYEGDPSKEQLKAIDDVLKGQADASTLPEGVREIVNGMRNEIDGLTREMISEGVVDGELANILSDNLGTYITRSYKVHTEPKWAETIPEETKNAARNYIYDQYKDAGVELKPDELEGIINELLFNPDAPLALLKGAKIGSMDLGVFKGRKDIPEPIRALLGEHTDPVLNYSLSVIKMANVLEKAKFLNNVKAQGMGEFFSENPTADKYAKISSETNKAMGSLAGLYTTPEIKKAFESAFDSKENSAAMKTFLAINGVAKYGKTIGSVQTQIRNLVGNMGFVIMQGHLQGGKFKSAAKSIVDDWANSTSQEARDKIDVYIKNGILGDSVAAGELMDYAKDAFKKGDDFQEYYQNRLKSGLKLVPEAAAKLYQASDNFFKIYAFENEIARYQKAHPEWSLEEVQKRAGQIVRNTYPTYSLVPKLVKDIRKFPLTGTFVSFPSEVVRTTWNTLNIAKEEMKDPATRNIGATRLAGVAVAMAGTAAVQQASQYFLNIGNDEFKDVRRFMSEWSKNGQVMFTGKKNGEYKYVNMSYTDPHSFLKSGVTALMRGDDLYDSGIQMLKEYFSPFITEDILTSKLVDVSRNKTAQGKEVFNPQDDVGDKLASVAGYLGGALEPGTATSIRKLIGEGNMVEGERKKSDDSELAALLTGQKITTINIKDAMFYKGAGYAKALADAKKKYNQVLYSSTKTTREGLDEALASANEIKERLFKEMMEDVNAAQRLGVSDDEIKKGLKEANVSGRDIYDLMTRKKFSGFKAHEGLEKEEHPELMEEPTTR